METTVPQTSSPDDGQDGEEIRLVEPAALGLLLGDGQDELAAVDVGLVLPHGLDALDEDVVVGVGAEGAGRLDVVEHLPEGLDGRERPALLEVVPPTLSLLGQPRIVEPQHPFAVQRRLGHAVFCLRHLLGCGWNMRVPGSLGLIALRVEEQWRQSGGGGSGGKLWRSKG